MSLNNIRFYDDPKDITDEEIKIRTETINNTNNLLDTNTTNKED